MAEVTIRFCPGVGLQHKICGGHKYQYFIPGQLYAVTEYDTRAGYCIKGPFSKVWVSHRDLRKWFPNEIPTRIQKLLKEQENG